MADFTPYSTAVPYFGILPQWASPDDAQRIASYQTYEEIYWNVGELQVTANGSEPIHIPAPRAILEATHRFLAVGWTPVVQGGATPEAKDLCIGAFTRLAKRETLGSKFSTQKRYGLIRGDAMFYITADPEKEEGSRISIHELDPASYFPIYDIENLDRIVGCHLVEQVTEGDKEVIRRQTYRKEVNDDGVATGVITSELALFEMAGWDDRNGAKPEDIKKIKQLEEPTPLPAPITQLPVYHWKNTRNPADPFGSSLFRGLERMAQGIDQTITDQDLSVALTSLGVYVTDSGSPQNDEGEDVDWIIGPGRVVEVSTGATFKRVQGITTVQPSLDHANYLEDKMREGAGVPSLAIGDVDVQTAESGIALSIRLAPLLVANSERELEILGVMDQMLYDLQTMWFPAYEGLNFDPTISVTSMVKDPMPENRQAVLDEILSLLDADAITIDMAVVRLTKLGWEFPTDALKLLMEQKKAKAAASDPFGARVADEITAADANTDPNADPNADA